MARKTIDVTISAPGRDINKVYRLTEFPASQCERWALRLMNAAAKSPGAVSPELLNAGIQGMVALALTASARADWQDIEPLLNEMFTCIQFVPNPANPDVVRRLIEDDIEEVATRIHLRREVLELHTGFFEAAVNWMLTVAAQSLQQRQAVDPSQNTPTSQAPSQP